MGVNVEDLSKDGGSGPDDKDPPASANSSAGAKPRGRSPLPAHLKRERIVHDLAEAEKHCAACDQNLREFGEETSERYEYIPAQLIVIEDVCKKYACQCTVKTAGKPSQPVEKSTAGASLLSQVIVAKHADHLPLHRQAKIFRRFGVDLSVQTMCGWMGPVGRRFLAGGTATCQSRQPRYRGLRASIRTQEALIIPASEIQ